jgi:hypothetical protein
MVIVHGELLNNQMVNQLSMFNQNTYLKKKKHMGLTRTYKQLVNITM